MSPPDERPLGQVGLDVSRETLDRLLCHEALLRKWNRTINLVSSRSLDESWRRHILDSAQVFASVSAERGLWLDFGSGGGFPGLVSLILAAEFRPELEFMLVESDKRKSAFLNTVLQAIGLEAAVVPQRIETIDQQCASIVSARAVAPLSDLLNYAHRHLGPDGSCVFPKGARYSDEIEAARRQWRFKLAARQSITDPNAAILVLGEIERV